MKDIAEYKNIEIISFGKLIFFFYLLPVQSNFIIHNFFKFSLKCVVLILKRLFLLNFAAYLYTLPYHCELKCRIILPLRT